MHSATQWPQQDTDRSPSLIEPGGSARTVHTMLSLLLTAGLGTFASLLSLRILPADQSGSTAEALSHLAGLTVEQAARLVGLAEHSDLAVAAAAVAGPGMLAWMLATGWTARRAGTGAMATVLWVLAAGAFLTGYEPAALTCALLAAVASVRLSGGDLAGAVRATGLAVSFFVAARLAAAVWSDQFAARSEFADLIVGDGSGVLASVAGVAAVGLAMAGFIAGGSTALWFTVRRGGL